MGSSSEQQPWKLSASSSQLQTGPTFKYSSLPLLAYWVPGASAGVLSPVGPSTALQGADSSVRVSLQWARQPVSPK